MRSLTALLLVAGLAAAQEKKEAPKPVPKIILFMPLGVVPGVASTLTARGLVLDQATEFRIQGLEGATVKIKSKGKAAMPKEAEPAVVGDTQAELEITLPAGAPEGRVNLVAVTPAGTTEPHPLVVTPKDKLVLEKEPNGGFAQAQPLEEGMVIAGSVSQPRDVDVFKVKGAKGETWVFEVVAARLGSTLDPILTLYSESGRQLATRDDDPGSRDATLKVTLPADGLYYLSLIDAHDGGDAMHVYHLHARRAP
jgi:hypothetical protein